MELIPVAAEPFGEAQNQSTRNTPLSNEYLIDLGAAYLCGKADATTWRPIDTAPKDGTYVLMTNELATSSWVGYYQEVAQSGYRFPDPWHTAMLNHWHMPVGSRYLKPTLWAPLPLPHQSDFRGLKTGEGPQGDAATEQSSGASTS